MVTEWLPLKENVLLQRTFEEMEERASTSAYNSFYIHEGISGSVLREDPETNRVTLLSLCHACPEAEFFK